MTRRTRRLGLVVALALGATVLVPGSASALPSGAPKLGMVCAPGSVAGSTHTFNLVAGTGHIATPEGNSVYAWGYADADDAKVALRSFQFPGPVLCVTQGETVVVNLANNLPEATSIVFPGQESVAASGSGTIDGLLTTEAPPGGSVSYSFVAGNAGTYLYESGSDIAKQIEMGLYGALVVRSATAGQAYGTAATTYDPAREYLILLSEIDPDLHHAVQTGGPYDFNKLHNRYFLVNGRAFPDTLQDNGSALLPKQPYGALVRMQPTTGGAAPVLVRMLNAGTANHPFHPHGNHLTQIAQDGRQLLTPAGGAATSERFGESIGSGQTQDYLLRWDNQGSDTSGGSFNDDWNPATNPLPVSQPSYLNLMFKDGSTWYSGNPYLGYKGTLPAGTNSLNVCGEWYFPWHSHALHEFVNFDEPLGGMATLLRVDPFGGCFAFPASTVIGNGVLKSGSVTALAGDDATYYQVNPRTGTRTATTLTAGATTMTVTSASGFPPAGNNFYIRIENEVMQVTGGQGTTTWTVARGQLGSVASAHPNSTSGRAITSLADDWYGQFTNMPTGAGNLKVTYKGKNCASTTGSSCTALTTNLPEQTVKICDWTIGGAAGCATPFSNGWVTLPAPPAQPIGVGSTDVSSTWAAAGPSFAKYIGTGANKGQVRILVHTQRWTGTTPANSPTPFSTWGNVMKLVYDAP